MLADASKSSLDDALKTWDVCMQVKAFVADGEVSDRATERVRDTLLDALLDAFLDRFAPSGLDDVLGIHEKLLVVGRLLLRIARHGQPQA